MKVSQIVHSNPKEAKVALFDRSPELGVAVGVLGVVVVLAMANSRAAQLPSESFGWCYKPARVPLACATRKLRQAKRTSVLV